MKYKKEKRDQLTVESVDGGKDEHNGQVNVHLSNKTCVHVDGWQTVWVSLIEVKQFPNPVVQENFSNDTFGCSLHHSITSGIDKPAGYCTSQRHDHVLRLVQYRWEEEEGNEQVELFLFDFHVCHDIDEQQGTQVDPKQRRDRQIVSVNEKMFKIAPIMLFMSYLKLIDLVWWK